MPVLISKVIGFVMGMVVQIGISPGANMDAYVIDPLSIFSNNVPLPPIDFQHDQFPPASSIDDASFVSGRTVDPHFPFIGEANLSSYTAPGAALELARWGTNDDGTLNFDKGQALARRFFQSFDDLQIGNAATEIGPPVQAYDLARYRGFKSLSVGTWVLDSRQSRHGTDSLNEEKRQSKKSLAHCAVIHPESRD